MERRGESERHVPRACAVWLAWLMRTLPRGFRNLHADDIRRIASEQIADAARDGGWARVAVETLRSTYDILRTATLEWWDLIREAGSGRRHSTSGSLGVRVDGLLHELAAAARSVLRGGSFSAVTVLLIALATAATISVGSLVHRSLLMPLPFNESDRTVTVWLETTEFPRSPVTVAGYDYIRAHSTTLESLAAMWAADSNLDSPDGGL